MIFFFNITLTPVKKIFYYVIKKKVSQSLSCFFILSIMAFRRPTIDEFDSLSLTEIGAKFKYDIEGTIRWCRPHGLLAESMNCSVCSVPCTQQVKNASIDQAI